VSDCVQDNSLAKFAVIFLIAAPNNTLRFFPSDCAVRWVGICQRASLLTCSDPRWHF
jgi:hypothetical protein